MSRALFLSCVALSLAAAGILAIGLPGCDIFVGDMAGYEGQPCSGSRQCDGDLVCLGNRCSSKFGAIPCQSSNDCTFFGPPDEGGWCDDENICDFPDRMADDIGNSCNPEGPESQCGPDLRCANFFDPYIGVDLPQCSFPCLDDSHCPPVSDGSYELVCLWTPGRPVCGDPMWVGHYGLMCDPGNASSCPNPSKCTEMMLDYDGPPIQRAYCLEHCIPGAAPCETPMTECCDSPEIGTQPVCLQFGICGGDPIWDPPACPGGNPTPCPPMDGECLPFNDGSGSTLQWHCTRSCFGHEDCPLPGRCYATEGGPGEAACALPDWTEDHGARCYDFGFSEDCPGGQTCVPVVLDIVPEGFCLFECIDLPCNSGLPDCCPPTGTGPASQPYCSPASLGCD